jgi:hypothetical protein
MNETLLRHLLQRHTVPESLRSLTADQLRPWKWYYLSGCIIGLALGPDWLQRHVLAKVNPTAYFHNDSAPGNHRCHFFSRVGFLAELIYNLQRVENFEDRLKSIRDANGNGVEAGIVELAAGKFFKWFGILFRFVLATPNKGESYDIEYVTTDGRPGRCEVECKIQSYDLNPKGIKNTLKHAKGQLPKGEAGIIMLRIPEEWWATGEMRPAIEAVSSAIEEFFAKEKTSRLSSVLCVQHRTVNHDGWMSQFLLAREYENPFCSVRSGLPPLRETVAPRSAWMPLLAFID